MPTLSVPKGSLEPPERIPPGIYDLRFDGFNPTWSNPKPGKDRSINLNPILKVTNSSASDKDGKPLNGKRVFENLNILAGWVLQEFVHCYGEQMQGDGHDIPGEFIFAGQDPNLPSSYAGPILGRVGKVELTEVDSKDRSGMIKMGSDGHPQKRTVVKRYICGVPGCTIAHIENLAKSS